MIHENATFVSAVADDATFQPPTDDGYAVQRVPDTIARADNTERLISLDFEPIGGAE